MPLNSNTSYEPAKSHKETPAEYTARRQAQSERKYETPAEHASRLAWVQENKSLNNVQQTYISCGGGSPCPRIADIIGNKGLKSQEAMEAITRSMCDTSRYNPAFTYNSKVGFYVNMNPDATRYYVENESDHSKYSGDLYKNNTHRRANKK